MCDLRDKVRCSTADLLNEEQTNQEGREELDINSFYRTFNDAKRKESAVVMTHVNDIKLLIAEPSDARLHPQTQFNDDT